MKNILLLLGALAFLASPSLLAKNGNGGGKHQYKHQYKKQHKYQKHNQYKGSNGQGQSNRSEFEKQNIFGSAQGQATNNGANSMRGGSGSKSGSRGGGGGGKR